MRCGERGREGEGEENFNEERSSLGTAQERNLVAQYGEGEKDTHTTLYTALPFPIATAHVMPQLSASQHEC